MDELCAWFYEGVAEGAGAAQLAAGLYYNLVVVHPFSNGNGRLCRLLAFPAFQRVGLPFVVLPMNGHSTNDKHFKQAWQWADSHLHYPLKHLELNMLQCLLRTCLNFKRILFLSSPSCNVCCAASQKQGSQCFPWSQTAVEK